MDKENPAIRAFHIEDEAVTEEDVALETPR